MIINFETYRAPSDEILGSIDYLKSMINHHHEQAFECELEISKLQRIINDRIAQKKHRERLNFLAGQYIKKFGKSLTGSFMEQIQSEFRCELSYAKSLADIIRKKVKKVDLKQRNARIIILSERMSLEKVGKEFGLTKQAIHKIVKNADKELYF